LALARPGGERAGETESERGSFLIWMRAAGADDLGLPPWGVLGIRLSSRLVQECIREWTAAARTREREREREREPGILKYRMEYVNGGREGFFDSRWDHRVLSGDIYMAPWILSSRILPAAGYPASFII